MYGFVFHWIPLGSVAEVCVQPLSLVSWSGEIRCLLESGIPKSPLVLQPHVLGLCKTTTTGNTKALAYV